MKLCEFFDFKDASKERLFQLVEDQIKIHGPEAEGNILKEMVEHYDLYEDYSDPELEAFTKPFRTYTKNKKYSLDIMFVVLQNSAFLTLELNSKVQPVKNTQTNIHTVYFDNKKELLDFITQLKLKFNTTYKFKFAFDTKDIK